MQIMIEMTPEHYDSFLALVPISSPEHAILKNRATMHRQINEGAAQWKAVLCCEVSEVQLLLDAARVLCFPAYLDIKKSIDTPS